jgi:hypothetical protein
MKREYRERPLGFDDLVREYASGLSLEDKLVVSVFVAKVKAAALQQKQEGNVEPMGVTDPERNWRLV